MSVTSMTIDWVIKQKFKQRPPLFWFATNKPVRINGYSFWLI